jgi:SAM-dependent methyltransferase
MKIPAFGKIYSPLWGVHPIDKELGIETSGIVSAEDIHRDKKLNQLIIPYIGSQPSIVRTSLSALTTYAEYTFVDYGCGKGRALVVASEFPFQRVVGLELSPILAATARSNASRVARRFSQRSPVEVVTGNACEYPLPSGKLTCFNYHAFGRELVSQMIRNFEAGLAAHTPHMFFVYYNPVHFELFDASPAFKRFYAQQLPYHDSEIGFGPDREDSVVIWQSVRGAVPTQHDGADHKVRITAEGRRAQLAD